MFTENDKVEVKSFLVARRGRRKMVPTSVRVSDGKIIASMNAGEAVVIFKSKDGRVSAEVDGELIFDRQGKTINDAISAVSSYLSSVVMESADSDTVDADKIDPDVWGVEKIVAIEYKDGEELDIDNTLAEAGAAQPLLTDLNVKDVKRGDVLWITAILKPKNKSQAYTQGQLGVLKVRVVDLYYNLSILKGKN